MYEMSFQGLFAEAAVALVEAKAATPESSLLRDCLTVQASRLGGPRPPGRTLVSS